jgi:plastocyanin
MYSRSNFLWASCLLVAVLVTASSLGGCDRSSNAPTVATSATGAQTPEPGTAPTPSPTPSFQPVPGTTLPTAPVPGGAPPPPAATPSPAPAPTPQPSPSATPTTSPVTITIAGMAFSPATASVRAGSAVRWHNADTITHTATDNGGAFDTGPIAPGATSGAVTLNTAGTFPYHCSIHPSMVGTLDVTP